MIDAGGWVAGGWSDRSDHLSEGFSDPQPNGSQISIRA